MSLVFSKEGFADLEPGAIDTSCFLNQVEGLMLRRDRLLKAKHSESNVSQPISQGKGSLGAERRRNRQTQPTGFFPICLDYAGFLWTLASDLLFPWLNPWWHSAPDSLTHSTELGPASWPLVALAELRLEELWLKRALIWHFHILVSRRKTRAGTVAVDSGVKNTWWPVSKASRAGRTET